MATLIVSAAAIQDWRRRAQLVEAMLDAKLLTESELEALPADSRELQIWTNRLRMGQLLYELVADRPLEEIQMADLAAMKLLLARLRKV